MIKVILKKKGSLKKAIKAIFAINQKANPNNRPNKPVVLKGTINGIAVKIKQKPNRKNHPPIRLATNDLDWYK